MGGFEYTLRKLRKCLYIYIGSTARCGLGIFAAKSFAAGEIVIIDEDGDYYGQIFSYRELRAHGYGLENTVQVGLDAFKLPNGNIDDFTNHSCDPNTGIRLTEKGMIVLAVRAIAPNEELTYDYSTHLNNPYESFRCRCGALCCRGIVGNFSTLPVELRRRYRALGIIGDFVEATVERQEVAD
jgi:SET domain-containing protein